MTNPITDPAYAAHDDLATRFFAAVEAGDIDLVRDLYDDDVTVWHNYDEIDQTKAQSLRSLRWFTTTFRLRYVEVRRELLSDGFWQQHVTVASHGDDTIRVPASLRVFCRGGKIARIEEYLDPAPVNAALAR